MKTLERWSRHSALLLYPSGVVPYSIWGWCGGEHIKTSPVIKDDGSAVTTESGSSYRLGEMHPDYARFIGVEGQGSDEGGGTKPE